MDWMDGVTVGTRVKGQAACQYCDLVSKHLNLASVEPCPPQLQQTVM